MENSLLINILSSFSQDAFAKFAYEMWTSNDIIGMSEDIETHSLLSTKNSTYMRLSI
jgi:hypothetical protein